MRHEHRKACATRADRADRGQSLRSGERVHGGLCIPRGALSPPQGKKRGTRVGGPLRHSERASRAGYALVAGLTPGLSLKNCLFISM